MLYRILTERKNVPKVANLVSQHFDGFTVLDAQGYWNRQPESSLVIEIETDDVATVVDVALAIKEHNRQDAVLIQRLDNHAWLV